MSPVRMEKLESAIRLAAALYESLDRRDGEAVASLLGEDCRVEPAGREKTILAERPEARISCEELIGFGHRCVARWKLTWKDAEGKEACLRGVDIIREKDEKIREILSYSKAQT